MAIVKFQQEATASFTTFYTFLQQNKEGTFLENATITFNSESPDVLTISDGTAAVELKLYASTSSAENYVVKLTGSTITSGLRATTYNGGYVKITGAMLCSTGLIFKGESKYSSSYTTDVYFILTVGSDGKLAVIYPKSGAASTNQYSLDETNVLVYDSTQIVTFGLKPQFDANITALAPIVSITPDNSSYLPFVQAATATQLPQVGLQAVKIDSTEYITNGVWYIKDGE